MKQYTVVCDPGIDDLIALTLLYRLDPQAKVCLVSTYGNAEESTTSKNAQEFILFLAKNWECMHGSSLPYNGKVEHPWPDYFHGSDAVWNVHPPVSSGIVKELQIYPETDTLISLATLTDPLHIIKRQKVSRVFVMGGVFTKEGNETPYAETNIAFDPDAARQFFCKCPSDIVKVVPLDVTRKVFWTKPMVEDIPENNEVNIWLKKLILTWFKNYNHEREQSLNLHDPLAIYLSKVPEIAEWINSGVEVITEGKKRGQTVFTKKNPVCQVAMKVTKPDHVAQKIFDLLFT